MNKPTFLNVVSDLRDSRGFSLAEVLVAVSVLIVSMTVVISSLMYGMTGVESSRSSSTAVFLAEQKLEQVRSFVVSTGATQGFTNLSSASYAAEAYNSITGYPGYRRTVSVTANAGGNADLKLVTVTVFYKPTSTTGIAAETSTAIQTLVSRR